MVDSQQPFHSCWRTFRLGTPLGRSRAETACLAHELREQPVVGAKAFEWVARRIARTGDCERISGLRSLGQMQPPPPPAVAWQ